MDNDLDQELDFSRKDQKKIYYEFLSDFREYLQEYLRESVMELSIAEISIHGTVELFDGIHRGKVTIKNQGKIECYLSTTGMGGYRLDPGESKEFFVNNKVTVTTISGTTSIGFIKS